MLLVVSLCSIGDPAFDRAEVDTRQGRLQAFDSTLARGSKKALKPTALAFRPFDRTSVRGT